MGMMGVWLLILLLDSIGYFTLPDPALVDRMTLRRSRDGSPASFLIPAMW